MEGGSKKGNEPGFGNQSRSSDTKKPKMVVEGGDRSWRSAKDFYRIEELKKKGYRPKEVDTSEQRSRPKVIVEEKIGGREAVELEEKERAEIEKKYQDIQRKERQEEQYRIENLNKARLEEQKEADFIGREHSEGIVNTPIETAVRFGPFKNQEQAKEWLETEADFGEMTDEELKLRRREVVDYAQSAMYNQEMTRNEREQAQKLYALEIFLIRNEEWKRLSAKERKDRYDRITLGGIKNLIKEFEAVGSHLGKNTTEYRIKMAVLLNDLDDLIEAKQQLERAGSHWLLNIKKWALEDKIAVLEENISANQADIEAIELEPKYVEREMQPMKRKKTSSITEYFAA